MYVSHLSDKPTVVSRILGPPGKVSLNGPDLQPPPCWMLQIVSSSKLVQPAGPLPPQHKSTDRRSPAPPDLTPERPDPPPPAMEWATVQHLDLRHAGPPGASARPLQPHAAAFRASQAIVAVAIGTHVVGTCVWLRPSRLVRGSRSL